MFLGFGIVLFKLRSKGFGFDLKENIKIFTKRGQRGIRGCLIGDFWVFGGNASSDVRWHHRSNSRLHGGAKEQQWREKIAFE